jgi:hypothetical protein
MLIELNPSNFLSHLLIGASEDPHVARFGATKSIRPVGFQPLDVEFVGEVDRLHVYQRRRASNYSFVRLESSNIPLQLKAYQKSLQPKARAHISDALRSSSIVFLGAVRDCEAIFPETFSIIQRLSQHFRRARFIAYENDSSDQTHALLAQLVSKNESFLRVIRGENLDEAFPERTERLAHIRNVLLEEALSECSDFDYLCVVDCDGIIGQDAAAFDVEGFLSNFEYEEVWDAVFPVTEDYYYDIWALRHDFICPYDYLQHSRHGDAVMGRDMIVAAASLTRQFHLKKLSGWLEVDSAFGGMGLYKLPALLNKTYAGMESGRPVCEHVPLHAQMRAAGCRLYINPTFKVQGSLSEQRARTIREYVG